MFVLTTQAVQWFGERGYLQGDIDALPVGRRELYNFQRNSAVLVKTLDKRKPDKHDRERIRLGMFVVATSADEKKNVDFVERIHEVAWLRADGGIHEIDEALKPLRLTTQAGNG